MCSRIEQYKTIVDVKLDDNNISTTSIELNFEKMVI